MDVLFEAMAIAILYAMYWAVRIAFMGWRAGVVERRAEAAFAAALGDMELSAAAKGALKLLFFPAGVDDGWPTQFSYVDDPPGEYLVAELEKFAGLGVVEELERAGLAVRGGTPAPVPLPVAKFYPRNMRRRVEGSTGCESPPASEAFVFLTEAGWALHPACRPEIGGSKV